MLHLPYIQEIRQGGMDLYLLVLVFILLLLLLACYSCFKRLQRKRREEEEEEERRRREEAQGRRRLSTLVPEVEEHISPKLVRSKSFQPPKCRLLLTFSCPRVGTPHRPMRRQRHNLLLMLRKPAMILG